MKKLLSVLSDKSIYMIYALGTVGLCWIGVWRDIGDGAQWALANNCVGFCLFPMILCRLKIKDFFARPYYIWVIIWAFAFIPLYKLLAPGTDYDAQIWSALINLGLYGLITIRLYFYIFVEKKVNIKKLSIVFWLWLVMMLLCIISVNEAKWPLWYLVMFGALYLIQVNATDYKKSVCGVTDGIIISFFWIQIRAFLYRPYDSGPSYIGHFTNANVNGMFYLLSLAAVLAKLWCFSHDKRDFLSKHGKIFKCILYVLSVAILDFVYFTGSRSAFLGVFGMIAVYLIAEFFVSEKKLARRLVACFCRGLIIAISFIVLLYPVYACARYIPALRHHPVWYRDYDENKVHSWDPIDSPKYTTFEMAVGGGLIQRAKSMLSISNHAQLRNDIPLHEAFCFPSVGYQINVLDNIIMISNAIRTQDYPGGKWVLEYDDGVEPGTDENHWAFLASSPPLI